MTGWIVAALVGLLAGWIAERIMNRGGGLIITLIVGLLGGVIGRYVLQLTHFPLEPKLAALHVPYPVLAASLLSAVVGAVLVLFLLGLFRRRS